VVAEPRRNNTNAGSPFGSGGGGYGSKNGY